MTSLEKTFVFQHRIAGTALSSISFDLISHLVSLLGCTQFHWFSIVSFSFLGFPLKFLTMCSEKVIKEKGNGVGNTSEEKKERERKSYRKGCPDKVQNTDQKKLHRKICFSG